MDQLRFFILVLFFLCPWTAISHPLDWACSQGKCNTSSSKALEALDREAVSCQARYQNNECDKLVREFPGIEGSLLTCTPDGICKDAQSSVFSIEALKACRDALGPAGASALENLVKGLQAMKATAYSVALLVASSMKKSVRESRERIAKFYEDCSRDEMGKQFAALVPVGDHYAVAPNIGNAWRTMSCNEIHERVNAYLESLERSGAIGRAIHVARPAPSEASDPFQSHAAGRLWQCSNAFGKLYATCYYLTATAAEIGVGITTGMIARGLVNVGGRAAVAIKASRAAKAGAAAAEEGALATSQVSPVIAEKALDNGKRLSRVAEVAGQELSPEEQKLLLAIHETGAGEVGKNGGVAGVFNYTQEQLRRKLRGLKDKALDALNLDVEKRGQLIREGTFGYNDLAKAQKQDYLMDMYVRLKSAGYTMEMTELSAITDADLAKMGLGDFKADDVRLLYSRASNQYKDEFSGNGFRTLQAKANHVYYYSMSPLQQQEYLSRVYNSVRAVVPNMTRATLEKMSEKEFYALGIREFTYDEVLNVARRADGLFKQVPGSGTGFSRFKRMMEGDSSLQEAFVTNVAKVEKEVPSSLPPPQQAASAPANLASSQPTHPVAREANEAIVNFLDHESITGNDPVILSNWFRNAGVKAADVEAFEARLKNPSTQSAGSGLTDQIKIQDWAKVPVQDRELILSRLRDAETVSPNSPFLPARAEPLLDSRPHVEPLPEAPKPVAQTPQAPVKLDRSKPIRMSEVDRSLPAATKAEVQTASRVNHVLGSLNDSTSMRSVAEKLHGEGLRPQHITALEALENQIGLSSQPSSHLTVGQVKRAYSELSDADKRMLHNVDLTQFEQLSQNQRQQLRLELAKLRDPAPSVVGVAPPTPTKAPTPSPVVAPEVASTPVEQAPSVPVALTSTSEGSAVRETLTAPKPSSPAPARPKPPVESNEWALLKPEQKVLVRKVDDVFAGRSSAEEMSRTLRDLGLSSDDLAGLDYWASTTNTSVPRLSTFGADRKVFEKLSRSQRQLLESIDADSYLSMGAKQREELRRQLLALEKKESRGPVKVAPASTPPVRSVPNEGVRVQGRVPTRPESAPSNAALEQQTLDQMASIENSMKDINRKFDHQMAESTIGKREQTELSSRYYNEMKGLESKLNQILDRPITPQSQSELEAVHARMNNVSDRYQREVEAAHKKALERRHSPQDAKRTSDAGSDSKKLSQAFEKPSELVADHPYIYDGVNAGESGSVMIKSIQFSDETVSYLKANSSMQSRFFSAMKRGFPPAQDMQGIHWMRRGEKTKDVIEVKVTGPKSGDLLVGCYNSGNLIIKKVTVKGNGKASINAIENLCR